MCKQVYLVGIGPGNENSMTVEALEILRQSDAISRCGPNGGTSMLCIE